MRTVHMPVRAQQVDMGGFHVLQPLPHPRLQHVDPFLLLHHAGPVAFPGGARQRDEGVPPHPHRGFEPVTFVFKGGVHHRDSRGNDHVVEAGGVQWMTAGMGIVHSERPSRSLVEDGGEWELIQLWINLPANRKMIQPRYQGLAVGDIPVVEQGGFRIQVVAGTYGSQRGAGPDAGAGGIVGPAETQTPITALVLEGAPGSDALLELPLGQRGFLYVLSGTVTVNGAAPLPAQHLIELDDEGPLGLAATDEARALLMLGEPIGEPVVSSGPFVMNTHTQIMEAMRDAQMGKMGVLIEEWGTE